MRRRGAGNGQPPERLMRFRVEDWPDPGPQPKSWVDRPATEGVVTWRIHNATVEWDRARVRWVRENARTLDDVNALFDPELGYDPPPAEDPRKAAEVDLDIILALNHQVGGELRAPSWQNGVLKATPRRSD